MTLGIDTDVLVNWAMRGARHHGAARTLFEDEIATKETPIAITPQVLFEFIHVVTDPRRFERPMDMDHAVSFARELWEARETTRVLPGSTMLHRVLELIHRLRLGRKRILDTALAVTLADAGVHQLATFNAKDYEVFAFLEVIDPRAQNA